MPEDNNDFDVGRRSVLGATGLTVLGALAGNATADEDDTGSEDVDSDDSQGYDVEDVIAKWDEEPRQVAEETMEKYDEPDEVVPSRLIWHHEDDDAPWKRTEMYRDPVPHNFPKKHNDYLEQFIDYHVPPHLYDEIATYDGSVMLERTKGVISARCDVEAMNLLAINLTHDIVQGELGVDEARRRYAEDAMAFGQGEEPEYTQDIQFEVPEEDSQRDPDTTIIVDGEIVMDHDIGPEEDAEPHDPEDV